MSLVDWYANGTCQLDINSTLFPDASDDCCEGGLFLAASWPRNFGYLLVSFLLLCYVFLGVALGADVFMTSIEIITSKEKQVTVSVGGEKKLFHTQARARKWPSASGSAAPGTRSATPPPPGPTRPSPRAQVWNGTVANLTLMALGSSAPEILLNVVDIFKEDYYSSELGPSTIVGSAAFNLMVRRSLSLPLGRPAPVPGRAPISTFGPAAHIPATPPPDRSSRRCASSACPRASRAPSRRCPSSSPPPSSRSGRTCGC